MSVFYNFITISFFIFGFLNFSDFLYRQLNVFVNRRFKLKSLYCVKCVQVLNRLKSACLQPAHPVSRLKKSFLLNSLKVPTLKVLCLKEFLRVWDFKSECGGSSPKLTPHTHPVCMGSVSERNEVSKFSSS